MNSESLEGTRGASITPSPRVGIHDYCDNMGRYGLNNLQRKNCTAKSAVHNAPEVDEVDNVMSKMKKISPLSARKKKKFRTNSYSEEEEHTDDNSSNMHSKSLPSTLSPHLYSSDDSGPAVNYTPAFISERLEHSGNNIYNSSNESSNLHQRHREESPVGSTTIFKSQESNKSNLIMIIITSVIVVLIAVIYLNSPMILNSLQSSKHTKSTQTVNYDKVLFENHLDSLKEKYNVDNNLILKLKTGISTIFSRMDAGSFMFVYDSSISDFNPSLFDKFIYEVVYTAARYLRNDIISIKDTVVLGSSLNMQEHGELINRYRDDLDKTGVLLVKEIDSVPSKLAMAFHYYCDEYDPLVKRSAIFFTLNLANCSNRVKDKKSIHEVIEKCLAEKWETVPRANIKPLLTRVVDTIIDLTSVI